MAPTIYDVAKDAEVSPKTAARILSGSRARKENMDRVLKSAKRLGYVRNRSAASLRLGSTPYLGVMVPSVANPFYGHFIETLSIATFAKGLHLITVNSFGRQEEENAGFELFLEERVQGAVINVSEGSTRSWRNGVEKLLSARIPTIVCGAPGLSLGAHELRIGDQQGIAEIVDMLAGKGHQLIAFVSGSENALAQRERKKGYEEAMLRNGLKIHKDWNIKGNFSLESGSLQAEELLSCKVSPTALVCANDILAFGAMRAAHRMGKRIPTDVAISGFDGVPLATFSNPELTTSSQPQETIATDVIDLLLDKTALPTRLTYAAQLLVRGST
ncbi:MAG: LacI family DNA-binding transcriptional regulator [Terrimicrobiaceae bacterium]